MSSLFLFGSVVRDEAAPGSDVDILVEFNRDARVGLFQLVRLQAFLSGILGWHVDLVTSHALHPMMKDETMREIARAA